jgi:hypothetical protein
LALSASSYCIRTELTLTTDIKEIVFASSARLCIGAIQTVLNKSRAFHTFGIVQEILPILAGKATLRTTAGYASFESCVTSRTYAFRVGEEVIIVARKAE